MPIRYKGPEDKGLVYGNRKILVLEDEEFVAHVCAEMMKTLGYEARFVTTGDKILQEYIDAVKCGNPYDAVILDLTVKGGMGGEKTMEGLREIDPHVNAIVSSGYADDPIIANYSLHGFKAVLAKPYRIEEVSKTLNEVFKNK